jgi:hypothetical protein
MLVLGVVFSLRRPVDNYSFRYVVWLRLVTDINEIKDREN